MNLVGDKYRNCETCSETRCFYREKEYRPMEMQSPCFFWRGGVMLVEDEKQHSERDEENRKPVCEVRTVGLHHPS